MPRSSTPAPLDDRSYWRRLLASVHPDRGGEHELFLFLTALREHVEGCSRQRDGIHPAHNRGYHHDKDRVPYDEALGFVDEHTMLTHRALSIAETVEEPFCGVLRLLVDYDNIEHGRRALKQCRGATWRQAGYIAHLSGVSKAERQRWHELCCSIPLSEALASHLINRLKIEVAA